MSPSLPPLVECGEGKARGFSLIEVLVALAIVGLLMAAIFTVLGTGGLGHGRAGDVDAALSLADAKLDGAGIGDALRAGKTDGIVDERFRWRLTVTPYEDRDKTGFASDPVPLMRLFRVEVTVSWYEGRRVRQIALATLRLAPVTP